jgi:iron complex outermembrane receptor protein
MYSVAAFVKDVFDEQYVEGVNNITTGTLGTPFASISAPRLWGVEFGVKF